MGKKSSSKKNRQGLSSKDIKQILRESSNQETIVLDNGSKVMINPLKHILNNEKYHNSEMNNYLKDVISQYKSFLNQRKEEETAEADFEKMPVEETGGAIVK